VGDFLPVESHIRIEAAHLAFLVRLNLILAHFHHMVVLPADFDGQVAKPLPGRDEGVAGDIAHGISIQYKICIGLVLFIYNTT
jgi:hypothetical protein